MTSHAGHTHDNTSAARRRCRERAANAEIAAHFASRSLGLPRVDQATSERRRAAARRAEQTRYVRLAKDRKPEDPCERLTPGCAVDHTFSTDADCEGW